MRTEEGHLRLELVKKLEFYIQCMNLTALQRQIHVKNGINVQVLNKNGRMSVLYSL